MQIQDECKVLSGDVERTITESQAQWRKLIASIEEAEDAFLCSRLSSWKRWFELEEAELSNWTPGGLRCSVRERIHTLLILPLLRKMQQRVSFDLQFEAEEGSLKGDGSSGPVTVLDDLAEHFTKHVKPVLTEAKAADARLLKKIKKTEKDELAKGIVALGMQDTRKVAALKRERPQIWEASRAALETLTSPARHLKAFVVDELSPEVSARKLGAVPAVVARGVCDWHVRWCSAEYEQLREWWRSTRAILQQRPRLWERLLEQEGLLMRRIELGIGDLSDRRRGYAAYATFGGSEAELAGLSTASSTDGGISPQLEDALTLLATGVSDMFKRLKAVRNSALWRVIETAQGIHKQLVLENEDGDVLPWQAASEQKGMAAFFEAMVWAPLEGGGGSCAGDGATSVPADDSALVDAAVVIMGRLARLGALAADVAEFFRQQATAEAVSVCGLLEGLVQTVSELNEDLLCFMDEPLKASAKAWLERWGCCLADAGIGRQIETVMLSLSLRLDSELGQDERYARRQRLLLLRGLQVFLDEGALCAQAVAPLALLVDPGCASAPQKAAAPRSQKQPPPQEEDVSELVLSAPPPPRPAPGLGTQESFAQQVQERRPSQPASPQSPSPTGAASFITPWRPDTPSTACDDVGHGPRTPSSKFIDGQYYAPRPDSPAVRLVPLSPKPRMAE
mmetsp:Transcript_113115/g.365421  ORF Transcript_113115/g.365421 Transcript_113115/m.365421 type:complete len:681 (-) Transcript_113115:365-2407(-)